MSSLAPGQRVEARCTRCRDITGHVIIALVDGHVHKVECCACGSIHKYYPAVSKQVEVKSGPVRVESGKDRNKVVKEKEKRMPKPGLEKPRAPKAPARAAQQNARIQAELERQWEDAIAKNPSQPVPYAMSSRFAMGALVEHPSFGLGMVLALTPPDKMEVLFREGIKALRCAC